MTTKTPTVIDRKFKTPHKKAHKSPGPKVKPISKYRGQGQ